MVYAQHITKQVSLMQFYISLAACSALILQAARQAAGPRSRLSSSQSMWETDVRVTLVRWSYCTARLSSHVALIILSCYRSLWNCSPGVSSAIKPAPANPWQRTSTFILSVKFYCTSRPDNPLQQRGSNWNRNQWTCPKVAMAIHRDERSRDTGQYNTG